MKESGHLVFSLAGDDESSADWLLKTAEGFELRKAIKAEVEAKSEAKDARRLAPLLAHTARQQAEKKR
jgi:hypothetical protein